MSPKLIALKPDVRRLIDEGYEVEIKHGYLLVHSVPYVDSERIVRRGTVVTDLCINAEELLPPKDHQVWFAGAYPCRQTATQIDAIRNEGQRRQLWDGYWVDFRFSNKIFGTNGYPDYYAKMTAYIRIISSEAKAIEPHATPCTFKVIPSAEEDSVFRYHDSASSRADIVAVSRKLAMRRIAIIGLGGTGSYVLDLVAKTLVHEIHLFDGDAFLQHNAFRAPGAASADVLGLKMLKVDYYKQIYDAMRTGLIPHGYYVTGETISVLADFDFVFICVDRGDVRKMISEFLQTRGVPFIDVGMELLMLPEEQQLIGTCRVTMSTPAKTGHFAKHVPMGHDPEDDLYRKNIQVADMNAVNGALAVIKWKQYCGFYQDIFGVHHATYSVNSQSLARDEMAAVPAEVGE